MRAVGVAAVVGQPDKLPATHELPACDDGLLQMGVDRGVAPIVLDADLVAVRFPGRVRASVEPHVTDEAIGDGVDFTAVWRHKVDTFMARQPESTVDLWVFPEFLRDGPKFCGPFHTKSHVRSPFLRWYFLIEPDQQSAIAFS